MASPLAATAYTLFWGMVNGAGLYVCRRFGEEHEASFQQFATGSAVLALALAVFLGGVMMTTQSVGRKAAYVLGVALFGWLTSLLFFRGGRSHYALPVGLHAGWNFTEVCLMGYQAEGLPPQTALALVP